MRLASSVCLLFGLTLSTPSPARVPEGDALRAKASFAPSLEASPSRLRRAPSAESRSVGATGVAHGLTCDESDLLIGPIDDMRREHE
jgi:hypothetical protein